jgi:hypothetical protein
LFVFGFLCLVFVLGFLCLVVVVVVIEPNKPSVSTSGK